MPIFLGIFLLAADQSDELIARAPPDEDGEYGVTHEHAHQDRIRRHERVHQRQSRHARISYPGKRAHAHFVGDDAGRQIEDERGDAVNGHERAELLVGATERLHQRIVEHHLQIDRTVQNRRAHADENQQEPSTRFRQVGVFLLPCRNRIKSHGNPLSLETCIVWHFLPELPASSRMRNIHSSWEPFIANASSNLH